MRFAAMQIECNDLARECVSECEISVSTPDEGPAIVQGERVLEVAEFWGPGCLEAEMVEENGGTFRKSHQTY